MLMSADLVQKVAVVMSWRHSIPIHPAAELFPLLTEHDLVALGNDIKRTD